MSLKLSCLILFLTQLNLGNLKTLSLQDSKIEGTSVQHLSGVCDNAIKYTINKIVTLSDNKEVKTTIVLIVDPISKRINLQTENKKQGKINFYTEIVKSNCTINEDFTSGKATYYGYVLNKDGSKSDSEINIRIEKGIIYIDESDSKNGRDVKFKMVVANWELNS